MASEASKEDYNWYIKFGSGKEILVTGDLDYIVTQYPFARYRPATGEDVERLERRAREKKLLGDKLKKALR